MDARGRGVTTAACALVLSVAAPCAADETPGFAERARAVVSVEGVLGVFAQTFTAGDLSSTYSEKGAFSGGSGARVAFHGVFGSLVTLGARVGVWSIVPIGAASGDATTFVEVGPRVGLAGAFSSTFGWWARVGPTLLDRTQHESDWYLDASVEAFGVWTPVDHFGVLVGPSADVGLAGAAHGASQRFTSLGFALGLFTDF